MAGQREILLLFFMESFSCTTLCAHGEWLSVKAFCIQRPRPPDEDSGKLGSQSVEIPLIEKVSKTDIHSLQMQRNQPNHIYSIWGIRTDIQQIPIPNCIHAQNVQNHNVNSTFPYFCAATSQGNIKERSLFQGIVTQFGILAIQQLNLMRVITVKSIHEPSYLPVCNQGEDDSISQGSYLSFYLNV